MPFTTSELSLLSAWLRNFPSVELTNHSAEAADF